VPADLRHDLIMRFYVAPDRAQRLRCIEREGSSQGRPVRYLRVFDPQVLPEGSIHRYEDVVGRGLLFEVRLVKEGPAHVRDLRAGLLVS
jgi:hypothetical protein